MQEHNSVGFLFSCGLHLLKKGQDTHLKCKHGTHWILAMSTWVWKIWEIWVHLCCYKHIQNGSTYVIHSSFCQNSQLKPNSEILPTCKGNTAPELIATGSAETVHSSFQNKKFPELCSSACNVADLFTTDINYCPFFAFSHNPLQCHVIAL